jgi:hypothetical protein
MKVNFNIKNIGGFNKEDYINKPILHQDHYPIGVIQRAELKGNDVIIEGEIWDRFIKTSTGYIIKDKIKIFDSVELNFKDYKSKVQGNKDYQNQIDIENAEFSIIHGC